MTEEDSTPAGDHHVSSRDEREARRNEREEQRQKQIRLFIARKRNKKILSWGIWILIIGGLGYGFYEATVGGEQPYTQTEIHWHAGVDIELCGIRKDLPRVPAGGGHFGTALTHTHDDNKLHLEGRIFKKKDANVGLFLDAIGVDYSETELYGKQAGDMCDGKPGSVHSYLNDKEVTVYIMRDYVIAEGDKIRLTFS